MKLEYLKYLNSIPNKKIRHKVFDRVFEYVVPFNRNLGLKISTLEKDQVVINSVEKRRRKNHIGSAHACFLALIGEYAAGLLLTQNFPIETFRPILTHLEIEYFQQGFGQLSSKSEAPTQWPEENEGKIWIEMQSRITNLKDEDIALCTTHWQLKKWQLIDS